MDRLFPGKTVVVLDGGTGTALEDEVCLSSPRFIMLAMSSDRPLWMRSSTSTSTPASGVRSS